MFRSGITSCGQLLQRFAAVSPMQVIRCSSGKGQDKGKGEAKKDAKAEAKPAEKSKSKKHHHREICSEIPEPRCGKEKLALDKAAGLCEKDRFGQWKIRTKKEDWLGTLWENPECCDLPCPDPEPRYDELYYKPSDKFRKYQRTWIECPEMKMVEVPVCKYEKVKYLQPKRRKPQEKPQTACAPPKPECEPRVPPKCPKLSMPRCRRGRDPPHCRKNRSPADCKKVLCPFPAFSECKKPPSNYARPVECNCLRVPAMCEVYEELKKRTGGSDKC